MKFQLTDNDYYYIYSKVPRFCVDLWIEKNDRILLVKRLQMPEIGKWHFAGGRVKYGESIFDACKRIGKEETGLNIKEIYLKGYMEFMKEKQKNTTTIIHSIALLFNCDYSGGQINDNSIWLHKDTFSYIKKQIHPIHYNFIKKYFK
jgi:ADP-ribose pyrophosphatase YjhB (NUDIX family)